MKYKERFMKSLLLDVGSSYIKYSFYDNTSRKNTEVFSVPFPSPVVDDGIRFEVDCNKIKQALFAIMNEAKAEGCKAVFSCVQMHGYIIRERNFSNYISWKDKRGAKYLDKEKVEDLFDNGTAKKVNLPRISLREILSFREKEFFTLGSYIAYLLTGKNITHITDACASGLYKVNMKEDNPFDGLMLPSVVGEISPCGKYENMDIYPPTGDHQISYLGSGATEGDAVLNLGTAAQLSILESEDCERLCSIEYRPYFEKGKRVATLSGLVTAESEKLLSRIKSTIDSFMNVKRILISGGGKSKYAFFEKELISMGYEVEICQKNVGNEGLKKLADSVYSLRGTMLSEVEFVNYPFVIKKAGLDFFIIDNEHGSFENKTINALALNSRLADIQAIVRLPNNDRAMITKLADGGVNGFLLPMTNSKEDIEKVVEYAKYFPAGKRGISTTRAHTGYGVSNIKEYMKDANNNMKIYAQIETMLGVSNVEEILKVSEVEGVFIGPNDLSCDYNCIGEVEKIKELISTITKTCVKYDKPCGIITTNKDMIAHALLCGCTLICYGSELNMIKKGAQEIKNEKFV